MQFEDISRMATHYQREPVTDCSICSKTFINPKTLPCFHTFCFKCLESVASRIKRMPEGNMQCPVCNKEFCIPKEGLAGLQTNLFIERLVTLTGILHTNDGVCDACMECVEEPVPTLTVPVRSYCFSCSMKLCDVCCKHHRISRLTENHRLVEMTNQTITVQLMEMFAPSLCELHKNEGLKLYCTDCESSVCTLCYIDKHQGHKFSDIGVAAREYRIRLRASINDISTCVERVQSALQQLEERRPFTVKVLGSLKNEIGRRQLELKELVDKHAKSLMSKLDVLKEEKLKGIKARNGDVDRHRICLESYRSYTCALAEQAMDSYICQVVESIAARALELKEMTDKMTLHHQPLFQAVFMKTNLQEFTSLDCSNIVGTIQDECENPKELTTDRNTEGNKELLNKIKQLTCELDTERSTCLNQLEKIKIFSQELSSERQSKSRFQGIGDRLKQDLARETADNKRHRKVIDKLRLDFQNEQVHLGELIMCKDTLGSRVSELEKKQTEERHEWMMKEKSLSDKVTELQLDLAIAIQTTAKVQKQFDDERIENKSLNSKIKKFAKSEMEFIKEKGMFATKERELNKLIEKLTLQEKDSSRTINRLKQEVYSEQTISNSFKAEIHKLQEQQHLLQEELSKQERDSQASCTMTATLQQTDNSGRAALEEQLKNISIQLEQAEKEILMVQHKDGKTIQDLEEKLTQRNTVITNEKQKFKERQTELENLQINARAYKRTIQELEGKLTERNTVVANERHTARKCQTDLEELQLKALLDKRTIQELEGKLSEKNTVVARKYEIDLKELQLKALLDAKKIRELEQSRVEVMVERDKILESQKTLGMLLYEEPSVEKEYEDPHVSWHQLVTYPFSERRITGLTVIESMLYVTSENSQLIDGYDLTTFFSSYQMSVTGLENPYDMKSARSNSWVYIIDLKCDSSRNEIIKVDLKCKKIQRRWSTGNDYGTLSVTSEGNVLLTVRNKKKLNEYTPDGQMIREVIFHKGIGSLWHAIKLTSGHYLVCHSYGDNGICIVDGEGVILKSTSSESLRLDYAYPESLVIDCRGSFMIADSWGGLLLRGSNLKYKKSLISCTRRVQCHGIRMHLDESSVPRLYTVDDGLRSSIRIVNFERQSQPVVQPRRLQRAMEMTINGLSRIFPLLFREHRVNETLILALQSQETRVIAGAIQGTALLSIVPIIITGLVFILIFIVIYVQFSSKVNYGRY